MIPKKKFCCSLGDLKQQMMLAVAALSASLMISNELGQIPCANSISCEKSLQLIVDNNSVGVFENQKFFPPTIDLLNENAESRVKGAATVSGEKHIYVDLSKQHLYAYEGEELFMDVPVSTGKWFPTPTGNFTIWLKVRSTRMSGGKGADYYDLPNVPYNMFFYNEKIAKNLGFALHGAYWHNNFGHPMSHGCVNLRQVDAKKLFEWTDPATTGPSVQASINNPGTKVTIYMSELESQ